MLVAKGKCGWVFSKVIGRKRENDLMVREQSSHAINANTRLASRIPGEINQDRRRKKNRLSTLRELGLKINSAFEEKTLAAVVCRSTRDVLRTNMSMLFTFETEGNRLRLSGSDGVDEALLVSLSKEAAVAANYALERLQILRIREGEGTDYPGLKELALEGYRHLICVPLRVGPLKVGALMAGSKAEKDFFDEEVQTVLLLSEQTAMAIRNVQLYERLRKQRNQLQERVAMLAWLHEATRSLNESLNTTEVVDKILEFVSKACGGEKGTWIPNRSVGIPLEDIATFAIKDEEFFVQRLLSGQPVIVNDLWIESSGTETGFNTALARMNVRSLLALPLVHENKVAGFISVLSSEPQHFSDEQLNILAILSYQAAVALQNASLFETANRNKAMAEDSARYLRAIIDNMSEGLVVYGAENQPEIVNPAFLKMFGQIDPLSGEKEIPVDSGKSKDEKSLKESIPARINGKELVASSRAHSGEIEVIEMANPRVAIQRMSSPLYDEKGNNKGKVVVYHDITEEREGQRARDEFMASVSHELRTPLTAIIGYTDILLKGLFGEVNEKQLPYLEKIKFSSRRLLSLITDILDLSRIQTSKLTLRRDWVDLNLVLERSVAAASVGAETRGISLEWDRPPLGIQSWVDQDRLLQVLDNLLGNAIKFTPDGGRVLLRARKTLHGRAVRVSVVDTGVGIAREHIPRVFDRFYQVDSSSRREYGGTGLGLSIARSLVELHGGTIKARSQPGKGSVFSFVIPIRPEGIQNNQP